MTRSLTIGSTLGKAPTEPTPPGKDTTTGVSSIGGGGGGGKKNTLTCPKCGDPCTHVETFVCKYRRQGVYVPLQCNRGNV